MAEALFAVVRNGQLVETKMADPAMVPTHKIDADGGCLLRPFIDAEAPAFNAALEWQTSELVVTPQNVTRVWSSGRLPLEAQIAAVRAEAGRRIYTPFPQWKQANYTARATELINLKIAGPLGLEDAAEFDALQQVWAWIKAVRVRSNALEAADPIPLDYADAAHWPQEWGV